MQTNRSRLPMAGRAEYEREIERFLVKIVPRHRM